MSLSLAVAAGLGVASNLLKSRNQEKYDTAAYRQNAAEYRRKALVTRQQGAMAEDRIRYQNRANLARQSAAQGEAGMGESPTALLALATSALPMEQDALNQRYQTESAAQDYLYQANLVDAQRKMMKKKKRNAFMSSFLDSFSSALSSTSGLGGANG